MTTNQDGSQLQEQVQMTLKDIVINVDLFRHERQDRQKPPMFPIPFQQLIHVEPISGGGFCGITLELRPTVTNNEYRGRIMLVHEDPAKPAYHLGTTPEFDPNGKICPNAGSAEESDALFLIALGLGPGPQALPITPERFILTRRMRADVCIKKEGSNTPLATPWICRITFT